MTRTKHTTKDTMINEGVISVGSPVVNTLEMKKQASITELEYPLADSDEIEVISLIPHVSYQDNRTNDFYEWEQVGHSEFLTYDTLKNMWRNSKAYFKDLWLKPLDDRVIKKFGLAKNYEQYELLMSSDNYTRENINSICNDIIATPIGLKMSIVNKIKSMVANGEITDILVIKSIEKYLHLDLTSLW